MSKSKKGGLHYRGRKHVKRRMSRKQPRKRLSKTRHRKLRREKII